jgi:hypothetical protein
VASIEDESLLEKAVREVTQLFADADLGYAVIGGVARNIWAAPMRATDDLDFVVLADRAAIARVESALLERGYSYLRRQDVGEDSGPDFVRMVSSTRDVLLDLQTAKTDYQELVVERAVPSESGVRIASPEDIIVLKLIAFRGIDQRDLIQLMKRDDLDWPYIEAWARTWDSVEKLELIRTAADTPSGPP